MKIDARDLLVLRPMALISTLSGLAAWGAGEDPFVGGLVGFLAFAASSSLLLLLLIVAEL